LRGEIVTEVFSIIEKRKTSPRADSYVSRLMREGWEYIARKIEEEATELIIASQGEDRTEIIHESTDLLFHLMVLLSFKGIPISSLYDELENRRKKRLQELARRKEN